MYSNYVVESLNKLNKHQNKYKKIKRNKFYRQVNESTVENTCIYLLKFDRL